MTWVLIACLAWLAVGVLVGIPLARAIRFAEQNEDTLTGWEPPDLAAPTTAPRERPAGQRLLPRRPRPGRPRGGDAGPGSPS